MVFRSPKNKAAACSHSQRCIDEQDVTVPLGGANSDGGRQSLGSEYSPCDIPGQGFAVNHYKGLAFAISRDFLDHGSIPGMQKRQAESGGRQIRVYFDGGIPANQVLKRRRRAAVCPRPSRNGFFNRGGKPNALSSRHGDKGGNHVYLEIWQAILGGSLHNTGRKKTAVRINGPFMKSQKNRTRNTRSPSAFLA